MAHLRCEFFSNALGVSTSMTVVLPQSTTAQIGMAGVAAATPPPVLYLLHGLSDDDTIWLRRTSIERYVAELGLAVVMPAVQRSFYTDEVYGGRYWTFVAEELPSIVGSLFRVSSAREDTFVAGLSMGGYGALKLALRHPDRYAAAASLSGALDVAELVRERSWAEDPRMMERIFGAAGPGAEDDLLTLVSSTSPADVPKLWVSCGTEDGIYDQNRRWLDRAAARGVDVTTKMTEGAGHTWDLWDTDIQDVLRFLPLAGR